LSAWAAGPEHAIADPQAAATLWRARLAAKEYLQTTMAQDGRRDELLKELGALEIRRSLEKEPLPLDFSLLNDITRQLPPPLHDDRAAAPNAVRLVRVFDDPNPAQPSEYAVWLPPEYHPARRYPVFIVLHGKESPSESLAPWIEEARRRGYILVAPEYIVPGQRPAYRYTGGEHAAVLLALRDAKRRFSIDSDRVYLAGSIEGGNMAWDFSLAHPDLLAGVAVISGFPGKYAWPYKANVPLIPMYIALGDLSAPTEDSLVFEQWAKPVIARNNDIRYVKMYRRGLEPFPEEIPNIMAWAAKRQRMPAPKQWEAVSGRESDDRFFGVVIRGFAPGRTTGPDAADALGKNIRPAELKFRANTVLNKATLELNGITALDVWMGPQFDFTKRLEVQINGKSVFKGQATPGDFSSFLEDQRIRADREQPYWLKVPLNLTRRGNGS
jgi:pimeloyl-ACP methyl ester carboxylesterase